MRVAELSQTHCLREEVTNDRKPAIISAKQSFFSYSGTTSPVARASRRFRMHATLDTSRPHDRPSAESEDARGSAPLRRGTWVLETRECHIRYSAENIDYCASLDVKLDVSHTRVLCTRRERQTDPQTEPLIDAHRPATSRRLRLRSSPRPSPPPQEAVA